MVKADTRITIHLTTVHPMSVEWHADLQSIR